ncbi:aldose 1-epimerase [Fuerstiella marisgermanici]|uniref:Aldose 1-epimerase n=1 Tax=Fuerstiella marisgermanici TaxID=1891926 RepID=A0A1P8WDJ6_9PLAN|nr:aldose 1-epimerase [Fuerstiella marisgermanici]APZ92146.1 Aldose 1-epimerase [Fuerstiella marisgermanici]
MQIVVLNDPITGSSAQIAAHLGFNCFDFTARVNDESVAVIHAAEGFADGTKPPSHSGIPLLFPFPNRIRSGRYSWDGKDYELPESLVGYEGSGNAIHGFCLDRPWRIVSQTESSVTGVFQTSKDAPERLPLWPADAEIEICYSLNNACLRADIEVGNPSDTPLPWGFGTHAYFKLPLSRNSDADKCAVYAPVKKTWELNGCLPTGQILDPPKDAQLDRSPYFGDLKVDDVYTSVESSNGVVECKVTDEQAGLQMIQRCDDSFREIVAFTPPWATAVCLEPYTCTTDAINLQQQGVDAGLQVLEPGGKWNGWIEIAVGTVGC